MHPDNSLGVAVAVVLTFIVGPLLLGVAGTIRIRGGRSAEVERGGGQRHSRWPLVVNSAILYTLAFNLIFFVQEVFLVVPKALTPGLEPTLFHNNHTWTGEHPLARLFQGTGALAILVAGVGASIWLLVVRGSALARLFAVWVAYHGILQALLQVPSAVLAPGSDVGMAFDYLALSPGTKILAALFALAGIAATPLLLLGPLMQSTATPAEASTARSRTALVFRAAVIPALLGVLLTIPFRVPAPTATVVVPPLVVALVGMAWMQAGAWMVLRGAGQSGPPRAVALYPIGALVAVLAFFHLVLAPGLPF